MNPLQVFNQDLAASSNSLALYAGEMTLVPHQGNTCSGTGSLSLTCGPVNRHIQVQFVMPSGNHLPELRGSPDGMYGSGTSLMRLPLSDNFFVFVTAGLRERPLVGEAQLVIGGYERECATFSVHLLNCLIPGADTIWFIEDWRVSLTRTECAYDLTRVSLPVHEINLTHTLTITRRDGRTLRWSQIESLVNQLLTFLSFVNCSSISAPVVYGYGSDATVECFRFEVPPRTLPTNRRTWASTINEDAIREALALFLRVKQGSFWAAIFDRAISWQILAEMGLYESSEQALFTVQMLLEMLSFVVLVEDAQILGEDGYGKLPASDRITLLCGHSSQKISLDHLRDESLRIFCAANSITNIGELITALRNKLIHPTKKNRDFLDRVPPSVFGAAVVAGLQIASLVMLKVMNYKGEYFDTIHHEKRLVPWG